MLGAGEAREVCADLGDEHFGGAPGDTGDGLHEGKSLLLSRQACCELSVQTRTGGIQIVEVGELLTQQKDMMLLQSANDCLGERVPLGPHPPASARAPARRAPVRRTHRRATAAGSLAPRGRAHR